MSRQSDTLTVALTGQLTFILVLSAFLALIASYLILRLYRRAVIKSMRRRSRSAILEPKGFLPPEPEHKPNDAALTFTFVTRDAAQANRDAATLYRRANRRRLLVAFVHTIAGCCFAAAMSIGIFVRWKNGFLSLSDFMFITWANAWPGLIAIDLVVETFSPRQADRGNGLFSDRWRHWRYLFGQKPGSVDRPVVISVARFQCPPTVLLADLSQSPHPRCWGRWFWFS